MVKSFNANENKAFFGLWKKDLTTAWTAKETRSIFFFFAQVMQKLGKADETRDAAFEEMVANFNKQTVSSRGS